MLAATNDSGRRFGEADLKIAMELASRAALLVDNARLYAEARTAVRSRDEMVAFVSHDLRDPLQSISAATASLRLEPQTAENADSIDSIARASTQMRRLVQDLLDVSMIEAGRLPDQSGTGRSAGSDPGIADARFRRRSKPAARASKPRSPRTCRASRSIAIGFSQVLLNLIGNALKFGAPGGLVTLGAERQQDAIRIWVQDTGTGIGPEQLPRVFDRFWRAGHGAGAGLGLAVAKGIVEAHGGQIGVTSQLGVGSTVLLHVATAVGGGCLAGSRAATRRTERVQQRAGVNVCCWWTTTETSCDRWSDSCARSVTIFTSPSAEKRLSRSRRSFSPRSVLMDIGLPGLSGYDTAREMRSRPWGEGISLVAVTGWARESDQRRALEAGFDRHLTKPVSADCSRPF